MLQKRQRMITQGYITACQLYKLWHKYRIPDNKIFALLNFCENSIFNYFAKIIFLNDPHGQH